MHMRKINLLARGTFLVVKQCSTTPKRHKVYEGRELFYEEATSRVNVVKQSLCNWQKKEKKLAQILSC